MNLIDIVKNAPEGAQRYKVFDRKSVAVEYYSAINGVNCFYNYREKRWREVKVMANFSYSLPLPKLETSYKKVEDVIWDLRADFEAGELYIRAGDDYEKIDDLVTLALALNTKACFYRVDKIIDEREAFKQKMDKLVKECDPKYDESLFDFLYSKGCRFID